MRYSDSTLGRLLKPISRRWFDALVDRHAGNAYDKSFGSWDHLVALVYAQLGGITSLRALEAAWNANAHHHYHLGVGALARSTLADANARRPLAIFSETFARLSGLADRLVRREGGEMLRLIDATPIPLGKVVEWAKRNGRIRGLKMHVVYDPVSDNPTFVDITDANVNDIEIDQLAGRGDARVAHDGIDAAHRLHGRGHQFGGLAGPGHIGLERAHLAACGAQVGGERLEFVEIGHVAEGERLRAIGGEFQRRGTADAAAGAGDHDPHGVLPSSLASSVLWGRYPRRGRRGKATDDWLMIYSSRALRLRLSPSGPAGHLPRPRLRRR